jgi:hypothetical protein
MFEFAGLIFAAVLFLFVILVRKQGWASLKTRDGKFTLFGLFFAPAAAVTVAFLLSLLGGCANFKDPYVEVYAGLEGTHNVSPQCMRGGANDQITSNLGAQVCSSISKDKDTIVCGVYRHHSCAISPDSKSYDAIGVSVSRRVYF